MGLACYNGVNPQVQTDAVGAIPPGIPPTSQSADVEERPGRIGKWAAAYPLISWRDASSLPPAHLCYNGANSTRHA